jgi:hypothetical protein
MGRLFVRMGNFPRGEDSKDGFNFRGGSFSAVYRDSTGIPFVGKPGIEQGFSRCRLAAQ